MRRCRVAVSAHRCADPTVELAQRALAEISHIDPFVVTEAEMLRVGAVRTRLITTATQHPTPLGSTTWIFSTDADSLVPPDWITATLSLVHTTNADLVLGLAGLLDWDVEDHTRDLYEQIVTALTATGHTHAYVVNLAISLTAFRAVGGFPSVVHGEEYALAAAVRSAGLTVSSPLSPRVRTSARMPGRADHGLGALPTKIAADSAR